MDRKTILKEIKKLINFSTDQQFLDAKATGPDGEHIVRVEADAFAVGLPLLIVTENGLIPAGAGEHLLEDGTKITTDEAGLITNVEIPQPSSETVPASEQMSEEVVNEDFYTWDACVADMMDQYGDENIANAVCGKIKADGYIMSKEEAFAEAKLLFAGDMPVEGATASDATTEEMKKKMYEMEARITDIEKMMNEMLPMMKETAEFGNSVINKIDNFVKDTPAEQQFASIKTEYKQLVKENVDNKFSGLEKIKTLRKK